MQSHLEELKTFFTSRAFARQCFFLPPFHTVSAITTLAVLGTTSMSMSIERPLQKPYCIGYYLLYYCFYPRLEYMFENHAACKYGKRSFFLWFFFPGRGVYFLQLPPGQIGASIKTSFVHLKGEPWCLHCNIRNSIVSSS